MQTFLLKLEFKEYSQLGIYHYIANKLKVFTYQQTMISHLYWHATATAAATATAVATV